ncbi:MAG: hypothetical protein LBT96_00195 [Campylobacteraceae bacterium]|jgi:hypothetical protein|nr:hypothetical protein [Campylobacteraceae bacterium]
MAKVKSSSKEGIEKLETIGLREVSRKTYIEYNYLRLMVNKEFSSLQRVKTLGFVKIIQREYGINMDDWVKEFEEYFQENDQVKPKEQEADIVLESHKNTNKSRNIYTFLAILFLVFFMIFAYSFTRGRTGHIESIPIDSSITYYNSVENETVKNASQAQNVSEETNVSANDTVVEIIQPALVTPNVENNVSRQNTAKRFRAIISPNVNIWVGVVELATLKRRSYTQEEDIDIDLNKEQLVVTGHGDFVLKSENKSDKKFNPGKRIYLYIANGTIEEISESDFILLNGGRSW